MSEQLLPACCVRFEQVFGYGRPARQAASTVVDTGFSSTGGLSGPELSEHAPSVSVVVETIGGSAQYETALDVRPPRTDGPDGSDGP